MHKRLTNKFRAASIVIALAACLCSGSAWGAEAPVEMAAIANGNTPAIATQADKADTATAEAVSLSSATITVSDSSELIYSGKPIQPAMQVKLNGRLLTTRDYTVSYAQNTNVGTASITITGVGNYKGSATAHFDIAPARLLSSDVTLNTARYRFDGKVHKANVAVKHSSNRLQANRDYTVTYSSASPKAAGSYRVTVSGAGNYTGTVEKTYKIGKANQSIKISKSSFKKTYGAKAFKLHAKSSGDGKLTYKSSNKHVIKVNKGGKVKIKGAGSAKITIRAKSTSNYKSAKKSVKVKVKRKALKSAKIKLKKTSYTYNGKAHKPAVTVKVGKHKLSKGSDYKLVYKRNVNAGTASVYVKGKGNYKGSKKATFTITDPAPEPVVIDPEPVPAVNPEPEIIEPEPAVPATPATVYITKTGECYHLSWCTSLRRSCIPISLEDAIGRGYRPCLICNP